MIKWPTSHIIGIYPAFALGLFFIGPLLLMLGVSFFERDPMAFFNPAFQFDNYEKCGLWDSPRSLSPSFMAVQVGLINIGCSVVGLMIYPQLAGRDRTIEEAARTLGTPPLQVFWKVLLPIYTPTYVIAFLTMFVYYLGVYVMPVMLGTPQDWNMTVLITDTAIQQFNMPLGAALSIGMMALSGLGLSLVWVISIWRARA